MIWLFASELFYFQSTEQSALLEDVMEHSFSQIARLKDIKFNELSLEELKLFNKTAQEANITMDVLESFVKNFTQEASTLMDIKTLDDLRKQVNK